ncbi:sulfotransferase family protein [Falsiroseomonas sp. HW251]|uniref:sulfotransferase family protein n=1 Tax=Falsiroseomonas sp. HW251 TaxID=3390998 RepID=UPI003D31C0B0
MTVSFLVAGVQKGGTTSLHLWLDQHPGLSLAPMKELHFFDDDEAFAGDPPFAAYEAQFDPDKPPGTPRGESTPAYLWWPGALERIAAYNAAMKLIVLLRCPMQRAWSQYRMNRKRGEETLSFADAIGAEPARIAEGKEALRRFSYVSRGRYDAQLARARALFPPAQLLVLKSEDFRAAPQAGLETVCRFLGVDPIAFDAGEEWHVGPDLGALPGDAAALLRGAFRDEVAEVEAMLGWDCSDWLA